MIQSLFTSKGTHSFIKYAIVGTVGTCIDVAVVYTSFHYLFLSLFWSTFLGFLIAASHNFLFNKIWTFGDKSKKYKRQYIKFFLVSFIGLLWTLSCMYIFVEILAWHLILSKLITSGLILFWNFIANKFWTFNGGVSIQYLPEDIDLPLELTILIPAYNERDRIWRTLEQVIQWKEGMQHPDAFEILIVDDWSSDGTFEYIQSQFPDEKIYRLSKNKGKGWAISYGVFRARGKHTLFFDADGSTPAHQIDKILALKDAYDIVIGSRYTASSSIIYEQSFLRRLISRIGNKLIQAVLMDTIEDTQCWFKLVDTKKARALFRLQRIERWWFDIEMLFLAQAFHFSIFELGIEWKNDQNSKFRAIRDSFYTFIELIQIKLFAWFGAYK